MTWTAERTTINQVVNIGAEATTALGTNVSASKRLTCFDWTFGIAADVKMYRPTGHKYSTIQEENMEWVDWTMAGAMDYNGTIYPLGGIMGSVSPVAHGASSTAKDWVFTPPIVQPSVVPQTYTIEQGDSIRAHKLTYSLCNSWGYTMSRKDTSINGKGLGLAISDGITLTSNPTTVALAPVVGKHVNVYLDSTSGALGTTQLTRSFQIDYMFDGVYGPFYPLNRANLSYTGHVDLAPKTTLGLLVEADSTGMGELTNLQTGSTQFMRVNAQGLIIDNLQTLTIGGGATGGTFTLSYKGVTTSNITYSATLAASVVNTAFQGLSTVGANCTVTGSNGGPYTFTFSGALASDMTAVVATNTGLTGGTPTITMVAQAYNIFQHDMALKVSKVNPFKDEQGIYAVKWEFEIVEDATWGKAQTITVTNLITAL
jgi:hypothetical protein